MEGNVKEEGSIDGQKILFRSQLTMHGIASHGLKKL